MSEKNRQRLSPEQGAKGKKLFKSVVEWLTTPYGWRTNDAETAIDQARRARLNKDTLLTIINAAYDRVDKLRRGQR